MSARLTDLLQKSSARHGHLCPRQVLGVRIGLAGLAALELEAPITKQTALIIVETDGCFADGVEVATGATIGHRSLRVEDIGKVAATFAEVKTGAAIRIAPSLDARRRAQTQAGKEINHYAAQLQGYQTMPDIELLQIQPVILHPNLKEIISRPVVRVNCDQCGEEIINERQVLVNHSILCRACADQGYYLAGSNPNNFFLSRLPSKIEVEG